MAVSAVVNMKVVIPGRARRRIVSCRRVRAERLADLDVWHLECAPHAEVSSISVDCSGRAEMAGRNVTVVNVGYQEFERSGHKTCDNDRRDYAPEAYLLSHAAKGQQDVPGMKEG